MRVSEPITSTTWSDHESAACCSLSVRTSDESGRGSNCLRLLARSGVDRYSVAFSRPYANPIIALATLSGFLLVCSFSVLHSTFWVHNDISVLVSSIVCVLAGLYLRRPIAISFSEDQRLNLRLLVPTKQVLVVCTWATFSLVAVQMLTWMHTGSMSAPDPITLMISSLTGDFVFTIR